MTGKPFTPKEQRQFDVYDRRHGTRSGYAAGCRCKDCSGANTEYKNGRSRKKTYEEWFRERSDPVVQETVFPPPPSVDDRKPWF